MSHGLSMFDPDARLVVHNRRYCDVVALPEEQVRTGITYRELLELGLAAGNYPAGLDADTIERQMWDNLASDDEARKVLKRGERIYAINPRRTAAGNLVATFEDITAKTQAEDALRDSETRVRAILDAMPDIVAIYTEDCSLNYINPQGLKALQADSLEDILALDRPLVAEEHLATWLDAHRRVIEGEAVNWTFEAVGLKGRRLHVDAFAVPFRLPDGARARLCIGREVSERIKVETALRHSEARLSAILDAMPDCVKIFAEDGTLTYINPQGLALLQASSLEELAVTGKRPVPEEYSKQCLDVHQRVIAGEAVNWTYEIVGLEGRRLHVEANAVPFRLPDGSKAHMCISRDISARQEAQDALRRSEDRLQLVLDATGLADFEAGPDGIAFFSERFVEQMGLPPGSRLLPFEDWTRIVHPDDRERVKAAIAQALREKDDCSIDFRVIRPDTGEIRWIASHTKVERDAHGHAARSIGSHLDITDRKRAEEALRESEERFRLAAEAAKLGVWDYDPGTGKREWSDRLYEILGLDDSVEPALELAAERVHVDDRARFLELLYDIRDNPAATRFAYTFRIERANDGAERWLTMNGWKADRAAALQRIILTVHDVTEERTAEERIRWNASHDGLTQLANRANFQEQLDNAVRAARKSGASVGLLMIDLDHFKQINDALGHQAGDKLLQSFADRLRAAVRPGDTVARLGGDEFAILVPKLSTGQSLSQLSASIHERLREPFVQNGRVLDCRVSIGAALYPQHGTSPKDLMVSADMALYAAKAEGRSTTIEYQPHLRDEVRRFAAMVSTAREAINDDRIVAYYQPKLNLADGSIVGFEALLRWRDRKDYVHLPGGIAAAFDDHEVAAELSDRIIGSSIADMREWLEQDVAFGHVAVNASAAEFRRDDFAERVLEALHKAEIPMECFQLEVTETVFLGRGAEYVQRALTLLSANGIKIALDDFGTGYASLRHLKEFPVDAVKIDKSFVRDMEIDPNDEAIIRAVVNLGKNLNIKVVAEGVESMSQAERLVGLGCDYGQGFLFSRAVPGDRVPPLVTSFSSRPRDDAQPGLKLVGGRN